MSPPTHKHTRREQCHPLPRGGGRKSQSDSMFLFSFLPLRTIIEKASFFPSRGAGRWFATTYLRTASSISKTDKNVSFPSFLSFAPPPSPSLWGFHFILRRRETETRTFDPRPPPLSCSVTRLHARRHLRGIMAYVRTRNKIQNEATVEMFVPLSVYVVYLRILLE